MTEATCSCCIVGGGPAGVLLALLLARKGVDVTLLELHEDFDRDFRGDTVHASTLEVLDQIGLAEPLHALPHGEMRRMSIHSGERVIPVVDLTRLPTRFPYVLTMPQVEFLDFLVARADALAGFRRLMGAAVVDLLRDGERVVGVRYRRHGEEHELSAQLVVGCDGRFSTLRKRAGLEAVATAPPMDVAWFRLPKRPTDDFVEQVFTVAGGRLFVRMERPDDWQIGYVFPKGDFGELRARGIEAFRAAVAEVEPRFADRLDGIASFDDVHLLNVKSDRLGRWYLPGLLLIGDAAHAMSPVGGIGINYAIGDAVEAANVLLGPLQQGRVRVEDLAAVQHRRERVTRMAQRLQAAVQDNIVRRALSGRPFDLPWPAKLLLRIPLLRDLPARMFALGPRRLRLEPRLV